MVRLVRDSLVPPDAIDQADKRSLSLFQSPSAISELTAYLSVLPKQQRDRKHQAARNELQIFSCFLYTMCWRDKDFLQPFPLL